MSRSLMHRISQSQVSVLRRLARRISSALALVASLGFAATGFAQTTVFWDTNGATAGSSGGTTATGTWNQNTTANWGTNATGTYTVTVSTVSGVRGITFEEGTVTLSGSTITLGASSTINTNATNA